MTALHIRIDKYLEGDTTGSPHVYARIYLLDEDSAQRTPGHPARQELIPVSHRPEDNKSINIEPGRYYVETVLPSGEILADSFSIRSGEIRELVLHAEYSSQEGLSWQHLVGNVQPGQPANIESPAPRIRRTKSKRLTRGGGTDSKGHVNESIFDKAYSGAGNLEATAGMVPAPEVDLNRPIRCISYPYSLRLDSKPASQSWAWLAQLSSAEPGEFVRLLYKNHDPLSIPAHTKDSTHAVFRVNSSSIYGTAALPTNNSISERLRFFIIVSRRESAELVSLPIPWRVVTTEREADIEIAIQPPVEEGGFCTTATALDEQLGMLLGYLSSGSLPTVRQMAEMAERTLYDKFENPFAAAAGAYALVGTALQATDQEWHTWVRNLMERFPSIPDGAIQWGQLKLRMRRDSNDINDARQAFKLAYTRGLPFYSMGMRWLLDGLEWAARDDAEAAEMLSNVRTLAWRTHYQQPFTILRLGGEPGV